MREKESSRRLPSTVRPLADQQDDVVTREQLTLLGISHSGVASRTAQGVWRELGPRVVVLHSGPLTRSQARWVGVLHAGPDAVLALATAAEAGGLRGFEEPDIQVAVEHGREVGGFVHPMVTVLVHQTRHVSSDVVPLRAPSRQTVARAIVELASLASSDNRTRALIAAAVQQRLVRPGHLHSFIATRPTLPKRRLVRETVGDVSAEPTRCPSSTTRVLCVALGCRSQPDNGRCVARTASGTSTTTSNSGPSPSR